MLAGREPFPRQAPAELPFIQLDEGEGYEIGAVFDTFDIQPNIQPPRRIKPCRRWCQISIMPELMVRRSAFPVVQCRMEKTFSCAISVCVKDKNTCSLSTRRLIEKKKR